MKFGLFHEFPCHGDLSQREVFAESFELVDEAERLGTDGIWLAEYHFLPQRSVLSSPVTIATAIAARTKRVRIGLAVQVLPLGNPVRMAEEIATLDHISQGRLDFGIGRSTFAFIYEGFGMDFSESRGRFDECLEIILKGWTEDQFSYEGDFYKFENSCVVPKPYQQPHPPISVGVTSAETFPMVGRMGYPILINPSRVFSLAELKGLHRRIPEGPARKADTKARAVSGCASLSTSQRLPKPPTKSRARAPRKRWDAWARS